MKHQPKALESIGSCGNIFSKHRGKIQTSIIPLLLIRPHFFFLFEFSVTVLFLFLLPQRYYFPHNPVFLTCNLVGYFFSESSIDLYLFVKIGMTDSDNGRLCIFFF